MKLEKFIEGAIGFYLLLPGPEDIITGGTTIAPSAVLGAVLLADAFGVKIEK